MQIRVTIIMGMYNCAGTLSQALDSIINQTYEEWTLIMCDDGSKDKTYEVAMEYAQKYAQKIVLIRNEQNRGLNYTLNRCLKYVKTEYFARMDADDYSDPLRLKIEIDFLDKHPEFAFVGCQMICFDENGDWGMVSHESEPTKESIVRQVPHNHPTIVIRKNALDQVDGYLEDVKLLRVEDYDLWVRLYASGYRGYNLNRILYHFRDNRDAIRRRTYRNRINEARVKVKAIRYLHLKKINYIYVLRPLIVGLLPTSVYRVFHRKNIRLKDNYNE